MRTKRYPEGPGPMLVPLSLLRAGMISFNEFERRTRQDWTRIAKALHQKWPLPPSVSPEDVRQELLLAIVVRKSSSHNKNLLEKWNPKPRRNRRGKIIRTPIDEYVVWNARVMAARWIHQQRGAKRNRENGDVAGKIKGTFLPVISSLEVSDRSDTFRIEVLEQAIQEQVVHLREQMREGIEKSFLKSTRPMRQLAEALRVNEAEIKARVEKLSAGLRKSKRTGMVSTSRGSERAEAN